MWLSISTIMIKSVFCSIYFRKQIGTVVIEDTRVGSRNRNA